MYITLNVTPEKAQPLSGVTHKMKVMNLENLTDYFDFLWLPVAWLAVKPYQRLQTLIFILICLFSLRAQAELVESTGHPYGFLPLFHSTAQLRGEITYSIIIALFLLIAYYSPRTKGVIFFAATLVVYIFAFCLSMVIMAV